MPDNADELKDPNGHDHPVGPYDLDMPDNLDGPDDLNDPDKPDDPDESDNPNGPDDADGPYDSDNLTNIAQPYQTGSTTWTIGQPGGARRPRRVI